MALKFSLDNIVQFFTFISPIFISLFLLIKSTMDYNIRGIIYLVGLLLNWIIGILLKSMFSGMDATARAKGKRGQFERLPIKMNWPLHAGQTTDGVPDYCSVFEGPWFTSALGATSMPSMNAMFHAFTFAYILMGVATNPNHPGIPFVIILALTGIINMGYRKMLFCDKFMDIGVGIVVGAAIGVGYFYLINSWNPTYPFYAKEDPMKRCKLGKTRFKCTYQQ